MPEIKDGLKGFSVTVKKKSNSVNDRKHLVNATPAFVLESRRPPSTHTHTHAQAENKQWRANTNVSHTNLQMPLVVPRSHFLPERQRRGGTVHQKGIMNGSGEDVICTKTTPTERKHKRNAEGLG